MRDVLSGKIRGGASFPDNRAGSLSECHVMPCRCFSSFRGRGGFMRCCPVGKREVARFYGEFFRKSCCGGVFAVCRGKLYLWVKDTCLRLKNPSAAKGAGMIWCKKVFVPGTAFPHPGHRAEQGRIRQGGISGRGFACCPFGGFALCRVAGL